MAKAKDTAKETPKARTSKAKEKAAEKALLEGAVRLDEGPKHQGLAEVVRAVLRAP